jgi:hypothetical protein
LKTTHEENDNKNITLITDLTHQLQESKASSEIQTIQSKTIISELTTQLENSKALVDKLPFLEKTIASLKKQLESSAIESEKEFSMEKSLTELSVLRGHSDPINDNGKLLNAATADIRIINNLLYTQSTCLFIYLPIYLFIYLSIYPPIYLSTYLPTYLCMFIDTTIYFIVHHL